MYYLIILLLLLTPFTAFGQHGNNHPAETKQAIYDVGFGDVQHPVSTTNAEAQKFFNQGLALIYGFNHDEAIRSFKRAAELDPQLAMAYWGIALANGTNYNLKADANALRAAFENLQKAQSLAPKASEHERAYIQALTKRYSMDTNADQAKLAVDYKNAMSELAKRYPDDLDAATLYAESMMNLRPWQLWSADGKPAEGTLEIVAVLEGVLRRNPDHIGANHYYIHAVEASPNPERALPSAARLGKIAPKAGHLVHMPYHIYVRTGNYEQAALSNVDAVVADREYITKSGATGVYPMMYYNHNIHCLASSYLMTGNYAGAIKASRDLEDNVKKHIEIMPMLEMFMPYQIITFVRFNKWDEVMKYPQPNKNLKVTNALWHFARGMAYAGNGGVKNAEAELKMFQDIVKTVPAEQGWGNNVAVNMLKAPENMLAGKIALARGDKKAAVDFLNKAVAAEDALNYAEPADWDISVRETLGGAYLIGGDYAEAEKVFRDEIAKHPRNGRALFGLMETLKKQGKTSSAQMVQREYEAAWAKADTSLSVVGLAGMNEKNYQIVQNPPNNLKISDVKLKTGVRLRYAEQGDMNGEPLIFLHGYSDSWVSYSRVLPLLDSKYHVYALTQRGHGESERPAGGYKFKDFAADVIAFMDAKGVKQATIVGHSMGSFVAQRVAVSAPERVKKLVLVGSATTVKNSAVRELEKVVKDLKDPVPAEFIREFQAGTLNQPVPEDFFNQVLAESAKLPAYVWQGVMTGMLAGDTQAELGKIKAPTLIIWGDKETVFSRGEQDLLKAKIANSILKVYPDVGHSPNWERPEQFAKDLQDFLSEQIAVNK